MIRPHHVTVHIKSQRNETRPLHSACRTNKNDDRPTCSIKHQALVLLLLLLQHSTTEKSPSLNDKNAHGK